VSIVAVVYLGLMLVNVVFPSGLSSGRAYFNLDWITLLVMAIITVVGIIVFLAAHRGREIGKHLTDTAAAPAQLAAAEPQPDPVAPQPEEP
jgi:hypothetical protein